MVQHEVQQTWVSCIAGTSSENGAATPNPVFSNDPAGTDSLPQLPEASISAMHDTEPSNGFPRGTENICAMTTVKVAPFLSAPVVQSLQAVMCGVGALQCAGALPEGLATGGLVADVCDAVRVAVEKLYQESYKRCVHS